ncbi:MAG: delta-60 repeat domain-containing protein, partial [Bacteroidota bacterium]
MKQWLLYSLAFLCSLSAFSQEQFDSTFATDGVFILDASPDFDDYFFDMIVLPDGKIIAVGYVISESGQSDMLVVKLEEDGALDTSFGDDGIVVLDINPWDQAFTIVPYSDGKMVIGGRSGPMSSSTQSCVVMLQADGSIDENFGTDGIFQTALGIGSSSANVVLIDGDNHILVGGDSNFDIHVYKLSPLGEPVPDYGENGLSTTAFVFPLSCTDMALQPNGELVLGGKANPFTDDIVVIRLLEDGSLDEDFG